MNSLDSESNTASTDSAQYTNLENDASYAINAAHGVVFTDPTVPNPTPQTVNKDRSNAAAEPETVNRS